MKKSFQKPDIPDSKPIESNRLKNEAETYTVTMPPDKMAINQVKYYCKVLKANGNKYERISGGNK